MVVWMTTVFTVLIIGLTLYNIIKILTMAYKRNEITFRKWWIFNVISIISGLSIILISQFILQAIATAIQVN